MHKLTVTVAAVAVLALAACGGSDTASTETSDTVAEATVDSLDAPADSTGAGSTADGPGLSLEEIGDDTMTVLGSYDINGDQLEDGVDGPPTEAALAAFKLYTDLIPAEFRQGIVSFVAIDQEASEGTDGALQDVSGPDGEPNGERYLALDVSGSSVELERTIVHETGHLMFVTPGGDPSPYVVTFNEQFPPGAEYTADEFVTEYAASSDDGNEDIAESWAMFVFGGTDFAGDADDNGELDVVVEGTLAADKVAFFEDYPELVQLRVDILSSLGITTG